MRKVISLMHVSLDGFVAGPNGEMDWIIVNEDMYKSVHSHLENIDTAIYGKTVYHMMYSYWPTVPSNPKSSQLEIQHAHWVEHINKIVVSSTLEKAEWNNTRVFNKNIGEEILKLKKLLGKDMMIFGSPRLTHSFMQKDLIDEFQIYLNPIIIGNGIPLFKDVSHKTKLKLLKANTFSSGVVMLQYETKR